MFETGGLLMIMSSACQKQKSRVMPEEEEEFTSFQPHQAD